MYAGLLKKYLFGKSLHIIIKASVADFIFGRALCFQHNFQKDFKRDDFKALKLSLVEASYLRLLQNIQVTAWNKSQKPNCKTFDGNTLKMNAAIPVQVLKNKATFPNGSRLNRHFCFAHPGNRARENKFALAWLLKKASLLTSDEVIKSYSWRHISYFSHFEAIVIYYNVISTQRAI